jgi:hypothetical protein
MDRNLIETYAAGGQKLRHFVAGLSREDLIARPGPGDWSIQELVMLTEDNPSILYADESAYVERLHHDDQSIEDALTLVEVSRRQWARVLRLLPDEAFVRQGTHNRAGIVTVGGYVENYIKHLDYHLNFLKAKRERLGKPLAE